MLLHWLSHCLKCSTLSARTNIWLSTEKRNNNNQQKIRNVTFYYKIKYSLIELSIWISSRKQFHYIHMHKDCHSAQQVNGKGPNGQRKGSKRRSSTEKVQEVNRKGSVQQVNRKGPKGLHKSKLLHIQGNYMSQLKFIINNINNPYSPCHRFSALTSRLPRPGIL